MSELVEILGTGNIIPFRRRPALRDLDGLDEAAVRAIVREELERLLAERDAPARDAAREDVEVTRTYASATWPSPSGTASTAYSA
jgi:hypothetical protein